jgi:tetratricopeptide (TPR) repeat protein
MTMRSRLAVPLVLLAAACAQAPTAPEAPKPATTPQITETTLRDRAREQFAAGLRQYEAGDYESALKSLAAALDHGLLPKPDQSNARKHLAFVHCAAGREAQCRDEFRKAFEIDPAFALGAAEDGHPVWGPVYRAVRSQLIAEREAEQKRRTGILPLAKAEQMLADGMVKYDGGDYEASHRLFDSAVKEGLKDKADKVRALKHMAFSLCLREKIRDCRAAFVTVYEVDPAFDLSPAEAGHPSWTRTFAGVKKAQQDKLAKEAREAKEKAAREKPTAPAAVPKKN